MLIKMADPLTILSGVFYPVDTTPPVVTCPADITQTVELGTASVAVNFPAATATDNSGSVALLNVSPASGSAFSVGSTTVIYTFVDGTGNTASCTFTISVVTGRSVIFNSYRYLS